MSFSPPTVIRGRRLSPHSRLVLVAINLKRRPWSMFRAQVWSWCRRLCAGLPTEQVRRMRQTAASEICLASANSDWGSAAMWDSVRLLERTGYPSLSNRVAIACALAEWAIRRSAKNSFVLEAIHTAQRHVRYLPRDHEGRQAMERRLREIEVGIGRLAKQ